MPLEIRELHIKVTVNQPQQGGGSQNGSAKGNGKKKDEDALIEQCVEEMLQILKSKTER